MKKTIVLAMLAAALVFGGSAQAAKHWDDMSWWGNTGATSEPQPDCLGKVQDDYDLRNVDHSNRDGYYWWWPTEPASNDGDSELWGNRGIVYHAWSAPAPAPEPKQPEEVPAAKPSRQIPVLNNVLFDFDKSVLRPDGKAETDKVINWMNEWKKDTVLIEGHTCDIGTDEYNMGLGQRRADSIKNYMVQSGIDSGRITTQSFGETQPAVPNTSSENRKLNRRGVFKITLGE